MMMIVVVARAVVVVGVGGRLGVVEGRSSCSCTTGSGALVIDIPLISAFSCCGSQLRPSVFGERENTTLERYPRARWFLVVPLRLTFLALGSVVVLGG